MTIKRFWKDAHEARFAARVLDCRTEAGKTVVVLDETAFYPTGGGQPHDTGRIGGLRVVAVELADDGCILHWVEGAPKPAPGEMVQCEIDWPRRLEMMQQHTGQHILSQAFFQLFGAETRGFRIADRTTEIDLTLELRPDELAAAMERAEELANRVVFENRDIRTHEVTPEQAAQMPLRKESFIADCIRVVEIDGYDWSPCGGTHARRTGEVGLIAVKNWERAKKMTRVHFVCGARALADYRSASRTADGIARRFTVGREEAEASVLRLMDETKRLTRRVRELAEIAATVEARELLDATLPTGGLRVVSRVFDQRDFEEVKLLAHRLVGGATGVVALLAAKEAETARLVFARSADGAADLNGAMRAANRPTPRLPGSGAGRCAGDCGRQFPVTQDLEPGRTADWGGAGGRSPGGQFIGFLNGTPRLSSRRCAMVGPARIRGVGSSTNRYPPPG
jgi:alanyl-tRNA synthetase